MEKSDRESSRFDKFKKAASKQQEKLQEERTNREVRHNRFHEVLGQPQLELSTLERDEAAKRFYDHESRGVMAKCRIWSTSDFELLRILGEGAFGVVYLVRKKDSRACYALKQTQKAHYAEKNRQRAYNERNALAEARSRWCVELHATFHDPKYVYMVMEFLQGGDLMFHLEKKGRFTQAETVFYMAELLEALDTVHKLGFVHRDVKPDNCVISASGHLKLLDFGLCRKTEGPYSSVDTAAALAALRAPVEAAPQQVPVCPDCENFLEWSNYAEGAYESGWVCTNFDMCGRGHQNGGPYRWFCLRCQNDFCTLCCDCKPSTRARNISVVGSPQYMAPEAFKGDAVAASDLWSIAIITYECLLGRVPFYSDEGDMPKVVAAIREQVEEHDKRMPRSLRKIREAGKITPVAEHFLTKLICPLERRIDADQCRAHKFFAGVDFSQLHLASPPIVPELAGDTDTSFFDAQRGPCKLPRADPIAIARKDAVLEWAHYDFDREAYDYQRPDLDVESFLGPAGA